MNYTILYGAHRPLAGENPARLERNTAVDAFALLRAIEVDHKIVMLIDREGKQLTRNELIEAVHSERDD